MMKKFLAIIAVITAAGVTATVAQSGNIALKEGTRELQLSGHYDPDDVDDYSIDINVGYGQFIVDNLELGVLLGYSGSDNVDIYGIRGFAEYNLDNGSKWVPYGRVSAGWLGAEIDTPTGKTDNDTVAIAGAVGIKYFLTETVAIAGEAEYTRASDDIFPKDNGKVDDDNLVFNLALRFFIP
jgi:opacity protein-like surface antigen